MISHIEQQNLAKEMEYQKNFSMKGFQGRSREKAMTKSPRNRIFKTTEEKEINERKWH
ncbi:hypothetical protein [Staphylococcus pseudintermedius]